MRILPTLFSPTFGKHIENYDIFKSRAQKGREYSHWIDLTLGIHFEVVIPESCRTKVRFISKSTFLDNPVTTYVGQFGEDIFSTIR